MEPATVPVANKDRGPKAATAGCRISRFDAISNMVEAACALHYMQCVRSWHIRVVMGWSSSLLSISVAPKDKSMIVAWKSNRDIVESGALELPAQQKMQLQEVL